MLSCVKLFKIICINSKIRFLLNFRNSTYLKPCQNTFCSGYFLKNCFLKRDCIGELVAQ